MKPPPATRGVLLSVLACGAVAGAPAPSLAGAPAPSVTGAPAPMSAATVAAPGATPGPWRAGAPGLEVSLRPVADALLVLVRLDPAATSLRVVRAEPGQPLTAAALAQRDGALAAINGSFFDESGRPIGWLVTGGTTLSPPAPTGWGAFIVDDGRARIVSMKDARGPADEALQAGPRLVIDGRPNSALKPQVARRAFVGLDGTGRVILGSTGPTRISAAALAAFLASPEPEGGLGLSAALNLDGGSSAQLFARDAAGDPIDLAGVPVPVLLEVLPRPEVRAAH